MTLRLFLSNVNAFVKVNPDALDMQVVASSDDEGNSFNPVYYSPCKGTFEDREFKDHTEYKHYASEDDKIKAVCIN